MTADAELLRAFEPAVRFTRGEYFFPVSAARYVEHAALWSDDATGESRVVREVGEVDLDVLTEVSQVTQGLASSLSGVDTGAPRTRPAIVPPKDRPPALRGSNRLASVGVTARTIDALNRLSLLFRGSVPGGSAARSLLLQRDHLAPDRPTYYGRVVRDGHWVVCQYWFFYAFNNWRSGFGGVNEHEGDWEQVTLYLDGSGAVDAEGLPEPRWVVFSAHDETGDDLRRRWDDPDLSVVEGRHPVVFSGAGSHSGAYLAGDYLITVPTPTLPSAVRWLRAGARLFTPWSTTAKGGGLAIPYVDYARGDGHAIGPGGSRDWEVVVLDESQPWVWAYRGLWGHDTRDRLGGERGPAGPRYERDGSVRESWADPVGWAGLAKVAPNPTVEHAMIQAHREQIESRLRDLQERAAHERHSLGMAGAGLAPGSAEIRALAPREQEAMARRMEQTALRDELHQLSITGATARATSGPHDHLAHRRLPLAPVPGVRGRLLSWWAVISTPLILCVIAVVVSPVWVFSASWVAVIATLSLISVEGLLRRAFLAVLLRLLALAALGLALYWSVDQWRYAISVPCLVAAVVVLGANLREAWRR
ncbi:MAG TPA: hypothetical protein VJ976_08635 [Ornithinimicrobium sp.]|uniref:hypothetical protein n=1 Tax=Ornithinimicrobium sp. TaxID=1977084 RepID=UPI002B46ED08|nr:hypothetical protein [Ornithinimicrobium sp.]HKJ12435.1 hypothetical protein [Ornithinimicrobium sp.]